ncbi:alpha/beta fold hydrolase [Oricola sp.]|uniref:alpha/beta hydrolase n=1 Tax=Oricola sp. TaxID=1979950 RepID=UPI0025E58B6A|nr:alpha/beta fold hydrolase [Oricola sp.]MCI5073836.1 alpha/beta fold hydrolase [Oricola sp.]
MTADRPRRRFAWFRTVIALLLVLIVAGALAWVFAPREPVDLSLAFDPAALGEDLDAYLRDEEAKFDDVRPTAAKEIVWAYPASHAKTPVALAYLHGFSAAKAEIRPVPDMAASQLGANLFYSRLAGHGRDGEAMAEATVNAWVQDAAEAVAIAERIGEKVVLIGTSTGGTLTTLAASMPDLKDRIDGVVLISPNFAIRASGSQMLTWPFAETLVRLVVGKERGFKPQNEAHGQNWTTRYPSRAVLPMAALVKYTAALPVEDIAIPALFVFHPDDTVVDQSVTAAIAKRWGGPVTVSPVETTDNPSNHVIAGDILSPSNNETVAAAIRQFVEGL